MHICILKYVQARIHGSSRGDTNTSLDSRFTGYVCDYTVNLHDGGRHLLVDDGGTHFFKSCICMFWKKKLVFHSTKKKIGQT